MKAIRPDVIKNFLEYAYRYCDP
jgi:SWI/SNF-related matrix-associated actin-dependent regulator of chromatin subfamily A-like protein 1